MDYIKLTGNNGSVPDPYFHQFSLTFLEDGNSALEIRIGRPPDDQITTQERNEKSPVEIAGLIEEARELSTDTEHSAMVGGSEKFIEINCKGKARNVLTVLENTAEFRFYIKCLDSFNTGLRTRLADIL